MTIHSIGHSTLSQEDFLAALDPVGVLIDVRSHPTSRWPQFRRENMEVWLREAGVEYVWDPGLGGWDKRHAVFAEDMAKHGVDVACYVKGKFPKQRIALGTKEPTPAECAQGTLPGMRPEWTNVGLRDYSWFMTLREFLDSAEGLIRMEREQRKDVAIMCCEAQCWRCHRSMIADYLSFRGVDVAHMMPHFKQVRGVRHVDGHRYKMHSNMLGNRLDRYEPEIVERWELEKARRERVR